MDFIFQLKMPRCYFGVSTIFRLHNQRGSTKKFLRGQAMWKHSPSHSQRCIRRLLLPNTESRVQYNMDCPWWIYCRGWRGRQGRKTGNWKPNVHHPRMAGGLSNCRWSNRSKTLHKIKWTKTIYAKKDTEVIQRAWRQIHRQLLNSEIERKFMESLNVQAVSHQKKLLNKWIEDLTA